MRVYVDPSLLLALLRSGTHVGNLVLLLSGAVHLLPNQIVGVVVLISLLLSRA